MEESPIKRFLARLSHTGIRPLMPITLIIFSVASIVWHWTAGGHYSTKCYSMMLVENNALKSFQVKCAKPFNLLKLYDQPEAAVEKILGPPDKGYKFLRNMRSYQRGGIIITYRDGRASHIGASPDHLPFKPEAILEFLSLKAEDTGPFIRRQGVFIPDHDGSISWKIGGDKTLLAKAGRGFIVAYISFPDEAWHE